jgi:hypothetical protein
VQKDENKLEEKREKRKEKNLFFIENKKLAEENESLRQKISSLEMEKEDLRKFRFANRKYFYEDLLTRKAELFASQQFYSEDEFLNMLEKEADIFTYHRLPHRLCEDVLILKQLRIAPMKQHPMWTMFEYFFFHPHVPQKTCLYINNMSHTYRCLYYDFFMKKKFEVDTKKALTFLCRNMLRQIEDILYYYVNKNRYLSVYENFDLIHKYLVDNQSTLHKDISIPEIQNADMRPNQMHNMERSMRYEFQRLKKLDIRKFLPHINVLLEEKHYIDNNNEISMNVYKGLKTLLIRKRKYCEKIWIDVFLQNPQIDKYTTRLEGFSVSEPLIIVEELNEDNPIDIDPILDDLM